MESKPKLKFHNFFALVTYLIMVAVNALANILPINGKLTGEISDSRPNLFAPAGETFIIWGVIYLLLLLYTLYQMGLLRAKNEANNTKLLAKVNIFFGISSLANTVWIFLWHYERIVWSNIPMLVILLCLIIIALMLKKGASTRREKLLVRAPFSVYFGWITVATIANVTTTLVEIGWDGLGLQQSFWTVVILLVGTLIAGLTTILNRDVAYGLVPIWAYLGILYKHLLPEPAGFAAQHLAVIIAVTACLVLLVVALFMAIFGKKKEAPEPQPTAMPEPIPTPAAEPLPMPGPIAPPEPAPEVEPAPEPEAGAAVESPSPTDGINPPEMSEDTKPLTPPQDAQL
ncbi:MAG TPA: hypothetical protein PKW57_02220 [Anaerolineaceae bacterium]|jgi:hypothetical protein|nr:hypothetical protein [Anaerolineaceae bacterium]HPS32295.1 hypothetical protein [Anaerolineaceae bacterium]